MSKLGTGSVKSNIASIFIVLFMILIGVVTPVQASECTDKIIFSEVFQSPNSIVDPKINRVNICSKSVLVVTSALAISDVVTNQTEALTITPVDNFTILIHTVKQDELIISFFSGNLQEFLVLNILENDKKTASVRNDLARVGNHNTVLFPILIDDINIETENLEQGDSVDVFQIYEQDENTKKRLTHPRKILTNVEIFSMLPNAENELASPRDGADEAGSTWVSLSLPPYFLSQLSGLQLNDRLLMLKTAGASGMQKLPVLTRDTTETVRQLKSVPGDSATKTDGIYQREIEREDPSVIQTGNGESRITIMRGSSQSQVLCSPRCIEQPDK